MLADLGNIIKPMSCIEPLKYIDLSVCLYISEEIHRQYFCLKGG